MIHETKCSVRNGVYSIHQPTPHLAGNINTHTDGIHAERDGRPSRLYALVKPSHARELERVVTERSHDVVRHTLVGGIACFHQHQQWMSSQCPRKLFTDVIRHKENNRSNRSTITPVPVGLGCGPSERELENESSDPYGSKHDTYETECDISPLLAAER